MPDSIMLVEDNKCYTYQEMTESIQKLHKKLQDKQGQEEEIYWIYKNSIAEELIYFLACKNTCYVPVILADEIKEEEKKRLEQIGIPKEADFGVLTSGTTGKSKLLFRTYKSWSDFFPIQNSIFSIHSQTVLFAQGSLAFTGNLNLYLSVFYERGMIVATKRMEPRYWLQLMKQQESNYLYLIPTKMRLLMKVVSSSVSTVLHFLTGSQSFGIFDVQEVKRCFPQAHTILYYGASEVNYITYLTEEEMTDDDTLVGIPFPTVGVTIENGMFYIENTYSVIGISGKYCTRDLGREENGKFYFMGREDDILNVNGKKYSAYKIEQEISKLPGIDRVFVNVEHTRYRDYLVVYYEGNKTENEVYQKHFRKQLSLNLRNDEIPKKWNWVEHLPETASGKIICQRSNKI